MSPGLVHLQLAILAAALGLVFTAASGLPEPPSTLSQWGGIVAAVLVPLVGWFLRDKLKQIHVLVNSNLTRVQSDLALALGRIEELESLIGRISGALPVRRPDAKKPPEEKPV